MTPATSPPAGFLPVVCLLSAVLLIALCFAVCMRFDPSPTFGLLDSAKRHYYHCFLLIHTLSTCVLTCMVHRVINCFGLGSTVP